MVLATITQEPFRWGRREVVPVGDLEPLATDFIADIFWEFWISMIFGALINKVTRWFSGVWQAVRYVVPLNIHAIKTTVQYVHVVNGSRTSL